MRKAVYLLALRELGHTRLMDPLDLVLHLRPSLRAHGGSGAGLRTERPHLCQHLPQPLLEIGHPPHGIRDLLDVLCPVALPAGGPRAGTGLPARLGSLLGLREPAQGGVGSSMRSASLGLRTTSPGAGSWHSKQRTLQAQLRWKPHLVP